MVVRHVGASWYDEVGCHDVEGVESECCGGRGRGRACDGACSDGPGHNEHLLHFPLGPCRGDVCGLGALSEDGKMCSLQWLPHQGLGCHWMMTYAVGVGDLAYGSAFGRT